MLPAATPENAVAIVDVANAIAGNSPAQAMTISSWVS
jgi:hypothetical protein